MTFDEFVALVERMREAQKAYFKDRNQGDLTRSKTLEHLVDKAVRAHKQGDLAW